MQQNAVVSVMPVASQHFSAQLVENHIAAQIDFFGQNNYIRSHSLLVCIYHTAANSLSEND